MHLQAERRKEKINLKNLIINTKETKHRTQMLIQKVKYPSLICGGDHFTKECPRHEEVSKFLKTSPTPAVLKDPFSSQQ